MTIRSDERKKKFYIPKIFATEKEGRKTNEDSVDSSGLGTLNFSGLGSPMSNVMNIQNLRVFVATWNVGGKSPHSGLNLENLLQVEAPSDLYVLGFQEIVPLNAGNVLVIEDNEPAAKWLTLINKALNNPGFDTSNSSSTLSDNNTISTQASSTKSLVSIDFKPTNDLLFFQKPSLKAVSKNFRTGRGRQLKTCNCPSDLQRNYGKDSCFKCQTCEDEFSSEDRLKYSLIASKQMVGIFVTVWARKELVQHIGHLRFSCVGRGIMGYLGNKGCISVSLSLYQTSLCFVCSHLASGEKEGDELRRNSDVIEILKSTQFPKICKGPGRRIPEKILEHDRVIWLGDLNYRIALSYSETQKLLEENDWVSLLEKDQLKIEREAGRVFEGWKEGKIYFAPTYKYSNNSDVYAGETTTSKKRRTPAWCDRILWHGNGIKQLSYIRGELRFSDHRPVCAVFLVEVQVLVESNLY